MTTIKTCIQTIDPLDNFRQMIQQLKTNNPALLEKSVSQLVEGKKILLKEILMTNNVKNESRSIYKIKRDL